MEENNPEDQGIVPDLPDIVKNLMMEKLEKGYYNLDPVELTASAMALDFMYSKMQPHTKSMLSFLVSLVGGYETDLIDEEAFIEYIYRFIRDCVENKRARDNI